MKISYEQYAHIMGYKHKHPFKKYFCIQSIIHNAEEGRNYHVINKIRMIWYIIFCIPLNIITLFFYLLTNIIELEWVITPSEFSNHDVIYAYPTDYPSMENSLIEVLDEIGG